MGAFDGVALIPVDDASQRHKTSPARSLVAELEHDRLVVLPDRSRAVVWRFSDLPQVIRSPSLAEGGTAPEFLVVALRSPRQALKRSSRDGVVGLADLLERCGFGLAHAGRVAVVPPVPVHDLCACRPLNGGRTHIAEIGADRTVCGRLPVKGESRSPAAVDCVRCLRSNLVSARQDGQLASHRDLVAVAGSLVAGAADRLWLRFAHRGPSQLPALLDSMVGAIVCGLPAAPPVDEVLVQVRRHREVASPAVLGWAGAEARRRLARLLPAVAAKHPTRLDPQTERQLGSLRRLLSPVEAAEELVTALEKHGPAPALEPLALQAARAAGDDASPRVDRWRRIQSVAQALGGAPSQPVASKPAR